MNREDLDAIAWATIDAQKVSEEEPLGYARCGRPRSFPELGEMIDDGAEFEHAWSEYLHEFFRFRAASFFAEPPPTRMSPAFRALLAGVAEYLSVRFALPPPEWIERPEFFLQGEWDIGSELFPFYTPEGDARDRLRAKVEPPFLRRGVLFEARNLITL